MVPIVLLICCKLNMMLSRLVDTFIRNYVFSDHSSMIDLYRVVMTKKLFPEKEMAAKWSIAPCKKYRLHFLAFPGDADLFFAVYNALTQLDERNILSFINIVNDGREPLAPDVSIEKFSEYIKANTSKILITECEQYEPFLLDIIELDPKIQFTLISRQDIKTELLSVVYAGIKNVKLLAADIYSYGFTNEKFDLIV